jgi:Flp pilus assembly pilin Flp
MDACRHEYQRVIGQSIIVGDEMKTLTNIRNQAGQGMTEYIIIVALIAVAAIGVYSYFGGTIRAQTAGMAAEMAGQSAAANQGVAKSNSDSATTSASKKANLGTYGNEQQ